MLSGQAEPLQLYTALGLKPGELVCLVGAGGKTSLMLRLAAECASHGGPVLVTTTTKLLRKQLAGCDRFLLVEDGSEVLAACRGMPPVVAGAASGLTGEGKVLGFSKEDLNLLWESRVFAYLLVEADGARGRPLKAPGEREPVLPSRATCILAVTGVQVLGRPLTEAEVHRSHLVAALAGQPLGSPVTDLTVLAVMERYAALAATSSPAARFIPVLNQADTPELQAVARGVARRLRRRLEPVLITSTHRPGVVREVFG